MRVLAVEDDPDLGSRLKVELERHGYAVDWVDNGVDGQFMGEQEPYDAVVLDLGLPGRAGLDVLRNWRAQDNRMPVLILTARDAWHAFFRVAHNRFQVDETCVSVAIMSFWRCGG